jgi:hypothetical protein
VTTSGTCWVRKWKLFETSTKHFYTEIGRPVFSAGEKSILPLLTPSSNRTARAVRDFTCCIQGYKKKITRRDPNAFFLSTVKSRSLSVQRLSYGLNNPSSSPGKSKSFYIPPKRPESLWVPPRILLNERRDYLPEIKWLECKVSHSPPSSAEVKNEWSYTTSPSMSSWHGQGQLYLS